MAGLYCRWKGDVMLKLNDVFEGEITINPNYIERKKPCSENSYGLLNGASTWINYLEPGKNAVHYYVVETVEEIQRLLGSDLS